MRKDTSDWWDRQNERFDNTPLGFKLLVLLLPFIIFFLMNIDDIKVEYSERIKNVELSIQEFSEQIEILRTQINQLGLSEQ